MVELKNGCKLNARPHTTLDVLKNIRQNMREDLIKQAQIETTRLLVNIAFDLNKYQILTKENIQQTIQKFLPNNTKEKIANLAYILLNKNINAFTTMMVKQWFEYYQKETIFDLRYEDFNINLKLYIFPTSSGVYCIPDGTNKIIQKFLKTKYIIDFSYNNENTHLSKQTLNSRKRKWNSLLNSNNINEDALTYEIMNTNGNTLLYMLPQPELIDSQITQQKGKNPNLSNINTWNDWLTIMKKAQIEAIKDNPIDYKISNVHIL